MIKREVNHFIALAARPTGAPTLENFSHQRSAATNLQAGEVRLKTHYLSLDPYMRGRMDDRLSYAPPVQLGAPMAGEAVSTVIESRSDKFPVGSLVLGATGWQSLPVCDGAVLQLLPRGVAKPSYGLSVLGMPGFTAWYGLRQIGKPKRGETVVVSAATGAVGSIAGQLAKLLDCRVVGVASGANKTRYAVETLGFDACIDRAKGSLEEQLANACPSGIDVYFENVGGAVLEAVWPLLNVGARIPVCGLIAQYNGLPEATEADRFSSALRDILFRRYTLRGFIILDHYATHFDQFFAEMEEHIVCGRVVFKEDVRDGLENAPAAFLDLLAGRNFGKMIVRIAEPEEPLG
jgi:NADPH-dependent curcumin reductase